MVFLADRPSFHFLGFFCGIPSACGPYSCNTGKWWSCSCCSGFHFRCGTRPGVVRIVQIGSMAVCLFASGLRWVRRDPLHWKRRSLLPGLLLHSYPLIWAVLSCHAVWPEKNRQMSIKVAQNWFHGKYDWFWNLYKNCLRMWKIWAN